MIQMLRVVTAALVFLAIGSVVAEAEEAFFRVNAEDLTLIESQLPNPESPRSWQPLRNVMHPRVVLDGGGEAYVVIANQVLWGDRRAYGEIVDQGVGDFLAVRTSNRRGVAVTGQIFWPKADYSGMVAVKFTIPASFANVEHADDFYYAKKSYYSALRSLQRPGTAWFRYQARQAGEQLEQLMPNTGEDRVRLPISERDNEIDRTYALFSGGRAVSENLQLDRVLLETGYGMQTTPFAKIKGITVAAIDWTELVADAAPELDPLAAKIPFDQHAVFFPSFTDFATMIDELKTTSIAISSLTGTGGETARMLARYEQQLGLSLDSMSRLIGPRLSKSVAITGSDPYLRTGTDVAILFETVEPTLLEQILHTRMTLAAKQMADAKPIQGTIGGIDYVGYRTLDRSLCVYLATVGDMVVVTNSPYQLGQLARVHGNKLQALAALPEYTFFRKRYTRGAADETTFAFLSDATIRRWCGPRWRILTSRRARDIAVVAELQASQMDRLAAGDFKPGPLFTKMLLATQGALTLTSSGVQSESVGSLAFMTPIAEITATKATDDEVAMYAQWRRGYESNWSYAFDPIGIRIGVDDDTLAIDLTIMPLIGESGYNGLITVSKGAAIDPYAGDPHDTLAHVVMALNTQSLRVRRATSFVDSLMRAPEAMLLPEAMIYGWLGESVALYVDNDPFWAELMKLSAAEQRLPVRQRTPLNKHIGRVPIGLVVEIKDSLRLVTFLVSLRMFIEQTAPQMTRWETVDYHNASYVRVATVDKMLAPLGIDENLSLYYAISPDSLTITLNEALLKRSIDRRIARQAKEKEDGTADANVAVGESAADETDTASKENVASEKNATPWLGENLGLKVSHDALAMVAAIFREDQQLKQKRRVWANLPILNEWHHRYPNVDPVELHERIWNVRIGNASDGPYVWNAAWQTMESTVYGHPGEPKEGPLTMDFMHGFAGGDFGLTFEEQGLRARMKLRRKAD